MKFKRYLTWAIYGVGLIVVFVFVTNLVIYAKSKSYIYKNIENVPEAQTVIIPGAALSSAF